jgi:RNA polymerase sigma factor for flagellar operon FliA
MLQVDSDEQTLWLRWRQERTSATRDALIVHYSPWARQVARDVFMRVYFMRDAWHDCVQNALMGLMEAIERFDPDRGVEFRPFARFRVRGAVCACCAVSILSSVMMQGISRT